MAYWFEKGELRRFPRVEMPMRVFIRPSQANTDKQIIHYPVNYLPTAIVNKINQIESELKINMVNIQEQREIIIPAFTEAIELVHTFGELTQAISQGKNPAYQKDKIAKLSQITNGFLIAKQLEVDGPKTYQFFSMIEEKFIAYSKGIVTILQNSSARKLYTECKLSQAFQVDKVIPKFNLPKYKQMPLANSLYLLSELSNLYLKTFISLLNEHRPVQQANTWFKHDLKISACGLTVDLYKDYPLSTKLDIHLFFPETQKTIALEGTLNRSVEQKNTFLQTNCIQFDFLSYEQQQFIENQQQIYQINRCIELGASDNER